MALVLEWLSLFVSSTFVKALLQRVFVSLGISMVTYTGMSVAVTAIYNAVSANFSALTGFAVNFLGLAHIPQGLNVIWSALVANLALRGLSNAGTISRLVFRGETGNLF